MPKKELSQKLRDELLGILKERFERNMARHKDVDWESVEARLRTSPEKLWAVSEMERTGGEPDVAKVNKDELVFADCSAESPKGRRSLCYDRKARDARKEHKPQNDAVTMSESMGAELLSEEEYRALQKLGKFDLKTSSWVKTPVDIRDLGGAIFCDRRYDTVFTYHNGADSYYAARGFRGKLKI
jgi:hypothetical protein